MAEVQKTVQTGELTQRFIEFVMMHAQNAALFLGQIPNPKTGEPEMNLDLARMFIDQLEMIQEKTRGNLTNEETMVLRNALSNLQMAYVEASGPAQPQRAAQPEAPQPATSQPAEQPSQLLLSNRHRSHRPSPSLNRERNSPKATARNGRARRSGFAARYLRQSQAAGTAIDALAVNSVRAREQPSTMTSRRPVCLIRPVGSISGALVINSDR